MKQQCVIIGIISLVFCIGLSGCTTTISDKDKIVGAWVISEDGKVWVFSSNNTVTMSSGVFNYRFEDDYLKIAPNKVCTYRFSGNDVLIITFLEPDSLYEESLTLTRKADK